METKKILVVDDDRDLVMSIETFLRARGYEVATAANGKEAYEQIVDFKPDLIVLDIMMDYEEEGMVLASALKTDGPTHTIPILILSGFTAHKEAREKILASLRGQDWPGDSFMQKPVRLAELADRVEVLLARAKAARTPWPASESGLEGEPDLAADPHPEGQN